MIIRPTSIVSNPNVTRQESVQIRAEMQAVRNRQQQRPRSVDPLEEMFRNIQQQAEELMRQTQADLNGHMLHGFPGSFIPPRPPAPPRRPDGMPVTQPADGRTHYQVLGVNPSADQESIDQAYKRLRVVHHPGE